MQHNVTRRYQSLKSNGRQGVFTKPMHTYELLENNIMLFYLQLEKYRRLVESWSQTVKAWRLTGRVACIRAPPSGDEGNNVLWPSSWEPTHRPRPAGCGWDVQRETRQTQICYLLISCRPCLWFKCRFWHGVTRFMCIALNRISGYVYTYLHVTFTSCNDVIVALYFSGSM